MARKKKCLCLPTRPGYYWATHTQTGRRMIVELRRNGFNHFRAYAHWWSRSLGIEEFEDYKGPLRERSVP